MLAELNYKNAFYKQYQEVEKSWQEFEAFTKEERKEASPSLQNLLSSINAVLTSQLLQTRGALSLLQEDVTVLNEKDLTETIALLSNQLNLNIQFHSGLDRLYATGSSNNLSELKTTEQVVAETIETLYAILRLLKKATRKNQQETSPLAEEAAKYSFHSLEKKGDGRSSA